jgi:hypothetical protein
VRLRVTYSRAADFLADYRSQMGRGGLLVRVEPPGPLERGEAVELEIATPAGTALLAEEVIQILGTAGIAVTVGAGGLAGLVAAAEADAPVDRSAGDPPRHEIIGGGGEQPAGLLDSADVRGATLDPSPAGGTAPPPAQGRSLDATLAKKIQQALHGDKNQRSALLRENNKLVHGYVVRNAQIQLDEVVAVARMTTVSIDVLTYIAGRREWGERPEVAAALVRNPRTPVPLAVRLLDHVTPAELRQLAKQQNLREAVQRAARKKVIG